MGQSPVSGPSEDLSPFFLLFEIGSLEGLQLSNCPSPGSDEAIVISLEDRTLLNRTECSGQISEWLMFLSSGPKDKSVSL